MSGRDSEREEPGPAPSRPARETQDAVAPDIVFVGNLIVDDVVFRDGRVRMGEAGGAMLYGSLAAGLWGARCGVVSVAGSDYPETALESLAARGVDLSGVKRLDRPGVRTWLLDEERGRRIVHQLGRPTHAEVTPAPGDIPGVYRSARMFHLAPVPFECQRALVEHLGSRSGAFVSLDPHETVREENLAAWGAVLDHVDALFLSEDELLLDGAATDPGRALRRLPGARPAIAAYKRGARGGVLHDRSRDLMLEWPGAVEPAVDSTGAGDAFAGGVLSGLCDGEPLERAIERGAVTASFVIEGWGTRGLIAATRERAEERRHAWFPAAAADAGARPGARAARAERPA